MKLRHHVRNRRNLKRIITVVMAFVITLSSVIVGESLPKTKQCNNTIVTQQKLESPLQMKKGTRYASRTKIQGRKMIVGATAYCGDTITSTGARPIEGVTIAVDPNVIPYGTKVYIPKFDRVFIAQDCGSAIKGNRIDIFMNSYNKCMEWGFRDIEIYILND